jgi:two-component system nitrate/nitrite response regulator NarL
VSTTEPIGVFVVGEIRVFRDGLAELLRSDGRVRVVGGGAASEQLLARIDVLKPDVAVLDARPHESLATVRALAAAAPNVKVVAVGVRDNEESVIRCAEAGVIGFVAGDAALEDLVSTIESAARDEVLCSPRMAATLLRHVATLAATNGRTPVEQRLTARELEIVELIDEGLSNKEIATRLCIEVATVKNHVHNILEKLEVRGRAEAAAIVRRRGRRLVGLEAGRAKI